MSLAVVPETRSEVLEAAFRRLRDHHAAVRTSSAADRADKLRRLRASLLRRRTELHEALHADFRKSDVETDITELIPVLLEIRHASRNLRRWMRSRRLPTPPLFRGTSARVIYEPKGVVLIVSPWNYPLNLSLGPVVSAVAAGNCLVLKPSELTPRTSGFLAALVAETFHPDEATVVQGDAEVAGDLLDLHFDHVYFTGSTRVGGLVMRAASRHLTPVTLELGGKSPTIVDETADIDETARRIVWGKFLNAGQTCIAPDYVYVHQSRHDLLVEALIEQLESSRGDTGSEWKSSPTYARAVSEVHAGRLDDLVSEAVSAGAQIAVGGEVDRSDRYMAPTILTRVPADARIMTEEIFGPVLPVLPYQNIDEVLGFISGLGNPLALYIFSRDDESVRRIMRGTSAGGTVVNDVALQFGHPELPFGGVGTSGMGRGHGFAGFKSFSNERSLLTRTLKRSPTDLVYPPYTRTTRRAIETLIRYLSR